MQVENATYSYFEVKNMQLFYGLLISWGFNQGTKVSNISPWSVNRKLHSHYQLLIRNSIVGYGSLSMRTHVQTFLQYFYRSGLLWVWLFRWSASHSDWIRSSDYDAVQLKHWSQLHGGLVHWQITRLKLATDTGERFVTPVTHDLLSVSFCSPSNLLRGAQLHT